MRHARAGGVLWLVLLLGQPVLAQVGPGDALAISCFWHSLLPLDRHDRPLGPVLTWRDLAGAPPPLGLFSTTTVPMRDFIFSAHRRPATSVAPPGANGTTSLIGRSG